MLTASMYPLLAMTYECLYTPFIFYVWGSKDRRDTPQLALHFQLSLVLASSEALFYGGLMQMASRYPESELPRYAGMSLLSRCASKIADRCGVWYWLMSKCWRNEVTANRDLIGRHSSSQYCYGLLIVSMMSVSGISMLATEAVHDEQFGTVYTRPMFWLAVITSAIMGVATEMCIAAVSWWQRREMPGADTLVGTFLALHRPGMQPFFTSLRQMGRPANREFENHILPTPTTDTCTSAFSSPEAIAMLCAVAGSYAMGPSAQALGLMLNPDSALCA